MTKKEAIEQLKQIPIHDGVSDNYLKTIYEAIDIAIEALEQQPCEDCISRQEALNIVHKYFEHYLQLNDDICLDGLRSLPSVTPKTGKWIDDYKNEIDDEHECSKHFYRCSECGKYADQFVDGIEDLWDTEKPNFCPNCGAKMEGE